MARQFYNPQYPINPFINPVSPVSPYGGNINVITPPIYNPFIGVAKEPPTPWGEKGSGGWIESGPAWIQSGTGLTPDWWNTGTMIDYGGIFTNPVARYIASINGHVIKGSDLERQWRIAVPRERLNEARQFLIRNNADYVRVVEVQKA